MKRIILVATLLLASIGCLSQQSSHAWWHSVQQISAGPAVYQGPGDVVGSAITWAGLRCYSLATCGGNLANVCTVIATVDTCLDFSSNATTGNLVIVTIGGLSCAVVTCTIKTLYDQTAGTECSGSPCNLTQSTVANRPTLIVSCVNSLPCARFAGSQNLSAGGGGTHAQPFTFSCVANRTGNTSNFADCIGQSTGSAVQLGFSNAANTIFQYASVLATTTASDNAFHAINAVYNSTSSILYVDGSSNAVDPGTNSYTDGPNMGDGNNPLTGDMTEMGIWASSFSAGNLSSMNGNQRSYWGF